MLKYIYINLYAHLEYLYVEYSDGILLPSRHIRTTTIVMPIFLFNCNVHKIVKGPICVFPTEINAHRREGTRHIFAQDEMPKRKTLLLGKVSTSEESTDKPTGNS